MRSLLVGSICIALSSGCQEAPQRRAVVNDPAVPDLPTTASAPPICGQQEFALTKVPPNVMLVLDRSTSMIDPIAADATTTKYDDLKSAIGSLVGHYDATIRFGATFFASDNDCQPGVVGPVSSHNGSTIETQLSLLPPGGNTPTAATLDAVIASHQLADQNRANYLVLVTDGMPNCDDVDVTSRIKALYAGTPSVRTFVIGIGSDTDSQPELLDAWADAGHTARAGDVHYYQSNSSTALDAAFDAIAGDIASCDFKLTNPPDPQDLQVTENGFPVGPSWTSGWTFDASTQTLSLHGAPCDAVKNDAGTKVSVVYGCPSDPVQ